MTIKEVTVVIAIGGKGSRLKKITGDTPKPLFPICGISTIERILTELDKYGFKKVIFLHLGLLYHKSSIFGGCSGIFLLSGRLNIKNIITIL